jgi:hypothetical protein
MIDDAHDTSISYGAQFINYWLNPLLGNPKFNDDRTLIVLTFDENSNYAIENIVYTLLLGNVIPKELRGTTDNTFYSHYSLLSTVENNWGLPNLGRGDVNTTMNNVFNWVAAKTGFKNTANSTTYMQNGEGDECGPLNDAQWQNYPAPDKAVIGPGGQLTHYKVGINPLLTRAKLPACKAITNNPYQNQTYELNNQQTNRLAVFNPI